MKNVLITSGASALSQRVSKLLPACQVFFADSNSISYLKGNKYSVIPSADKSTYVHEVLKVCLDLSIDTLIPLGKTELMPLAESRILFEEYGIELALPPLEQLVAIATVLNPNRQDFPEIDIILDATWKGVFAKQADGTWGLCCVA